MCTKIWSKRYINYLPKGEDRKNSGELEEEVKMK